MPRGRGKSHKGKTRHFTSADELARQAKDVKNWRRKDDDDEDEDPDVKGGEDKDDDDEEDDEEETKQEGVASLINIENPNRAAQKSHKVDELDVDTAKPELTRREREAIEKEQSRLRYQKLQAEGKTEEARADLARLAIIRKQREEAAKKKEEEKKAKEKQQAAAAEAAKASQQQLQAVAGSHKAARKKRK